LIALAVFVKNPIPGKVKTRIGNEIGHEAATEIYKRLLSLLFKQLSKIQDTVDIHIFYADEIAEKDLWNDLNCKKHKQIGHDIGERMFHAFELLLHDYKKVILFGSDIPQLNASHIFKAIESLDFHDIVLGPSSDGGYYLMGCTSIQKSLFSNIEWSTNQVLNKTIQAIGTCGLEFELIEELTDIDTYDDWLKSGIDLH